MQFMSRIPDCLGSCLGSWAVSFCWRHSMERVLVVGVTELTHQVLVMLLTASLELVIKCILQTGNECPGTDKKSQHTNRAVLSLNEQTLATWKSIQLGSLWEELHGCARGSWVFAHMSLSEHPREGKSTESCPNSVMTKDRNVSWLKSSIYHLKKRGSAAPYRGPNDCG